jgi:hypothetical protein
MVRCCRGYPPPACPIKIWLTNVGASVRFLTLTSDFSILGISCAARSSLQAALVPLEAFEVLVLIALTAETASWHLIVTQSSRDCHAWRCRRARPCLVFSTTELWLATGPCEASADVSSWRHKADIADELRDVLC